MSFLFITPYVHNFLTSISCIECIPQRWPSWPKYVVKHIKSLTTINKLLLWLTDYTNILCPCDSQITPIYYVHVTHITPIYYVHVTHRLHQYTMSMWLTDYTNILCPCDSQITPIYYVFHWWNWNSEMSLQVSSTKDAETELERRLMNVTQREEGTKQDEKQTEQQNTDDFWLDKSSLEWDTVIEEKRGDKDGWPVCNICYFTVTLHIVLCIDLISVLRTQ